MILRCLLLVLFSFSAFGADIYDFKLKGAKGKDFAFENYKDKPILVVNIATKCGYTPQLDDLEKLAKKYQGKLTVVGVPSNDFGGQTPEGNKEVAEFCRLNYGVTFPLTEKLVVKGDKKHPLYKFLTQKKEVGWNFEKFLVGKDGKVVKRFNSGVAPMGEEMIQAIEKLL